MSQPAKFTFANEFATGGKQKELEREIARLQALLPQAEARAIDQGKKQAGSELAHALDHALNGLKALEIERERLKQEAVELAVLSARTLAGHVLEQMPHEAIRTLAAGCIDNLRKCPHIVFRVHPGHVANVEQTLKTLAHERGIEGKLIVIGDPEKAASDCKIEWAEGGYEHRRAAVEQKINEAVQSFLAENLNHTNPVKAENTHG
jgi:flagellar assembly protein FliH